MYLEEEVKEIQASIAGDIAPSREEVTAALDAFRADIPSREITNIFEPFLDSLFGLFIRNRDLYERLMGDERVKKYALFGFFPETYDLVYGSEESPKISFDGRNRGTVALLRHTTKSRVIKPWQSSREGEIAQIASDTGVGPHQYATLSHYLTEELVEGTLFSKLREDGASTERMYELGKRMGEMLTQLHSRDVFYNDTTLSDDMGRSHLIVPDEKPAKIIDFGVAILLDRHPALSDEDVFNYARTLPFGTDSIQMRLMKGESYASVVKSMADRHRGRVEQLTKEEIFARDDNLVMEGIHCASLRTSANIADPFMKGFSETYSP